MQILTDEEIHLYQLDILKAIDEWCRKNEVRYFLAWGTLLGAVRHKGYIPWDDDIDICLFREDYERFIREFNKDRQDSFTVLHFPQDKKYPYEYAKVSDNRTRVIENNNTSYEMGLNVDVFVLDAVGDQQQRKSLTKQVRFVSRLLEIKFMVTNRRKKEMGQPRPFAKRVAVNMMKAVTSCFPLAWCLKKMDRIGKESNRLHDADSPWVAAVVERWSKPEKRLEKAWFEQDTELEFEGYSFKVPANYDEVLTTWYGDYMQFPPKEEQVTHHDYQAYKI